MQSASKRRLFIALPLILAFAMKAAMATLLVDQLARNERGGRHRSR